MFRNVLECSRISERGQVSAKGHTLPRGLGCLVGVGQYNNTDTGDYYEIFIYFLHITA